MSLLLHFEVYGQGQPVVFLPGMLGTTRCWYQLKELLVDKFQLILIDLLGFGRSPKDPPLEFSMRQHLDYLDQTLVKVAPPQPFTVVAHSMGGILALAYAHKYPHKVKQLILIAPPIFKNRAEAKENVIAYSSFPEFFLYGWSAQIICKLLCQWLRPLTSIYLEKKFKNLPKTVAHDALLHNFHSYSKSLQALIENQNVFETVSQIKCLVKLIYGTADGRVIKENYQQLASLNPKIKLIEIDHGTHDLVFTHPQQIIHYLP